MQIKIAYKGVHSLSRYSKLFIYLSLTLLCLIAFGEGLWSRPVAEDFFPVNWYLNFGPDTHFRPAMGMLFAMLHQVFGPIYDNSHPYHLASLILHICTTFVVLSLASKLTRSHMLGLACAILFAVYPRSHEPVFWFAAIVHPMAMLLVLLAFRLYLWHSDEGNTLGLYLSGLAWLAAFLSLEGAFVGVALLAVYVFMFQTRTSLGWGKRVASTVRSIAYVAVPVMIYLALLLFAKGSLSNLLHDATQGEFYRPAISLSKVQDFLGYVTYAVLPFVPLRVASPLIKYTSLALVCLILILGFWKGTRLMRFAVLWIVVSVLPFVLLVPTGNADRYFYLSSFGFSVLAVAVIERMIEFARIRVAGAEAAKRLILFGVLVIYASTSVVILHRYSAMWQESGMRVNAMLNAIKSNVRDLRHDQTVVFLNMPQDYNGVRFMSTGIATAMRVMYQMPDLDVRSTVDQNLILKVGEQRHMHPALSNTSHAFRIFEYQNGYFEEWNDVALTAELEQRLLSIEQFP